MSYILLGECLLGCSAANSLQFTACCCSCCDKFMEERKRHKKLHESSCNSVREVPTVMASLDKTLREVNVRSLKG